MSSMQFIAAGHQTQQSNIFGTLPDGQPITPVPLDQADPNSPIASDPPENITVYAYPNYSGVYVNGDWGTNIQGDSNGDYYRLFNGGPGANVSYNQVAQAAGPNTDYANVCAALGRSDYNTAISIIENDIVHFKNGVSGNDNAASIAQGNANIGAAIGNAATAFADMMAVSALAQSSQFLKDSDLDGMLTMNAAAASEACKAINAFSDPNTQEAVYAIGQSLSVMDDAAKQVRQAQHKSVPNDVVPNSLRNSPTFSGAQATASPTFNPNAPIGGSTNQYYSAAQQAIQLATSPNHTGHG